MTTMANEDQKAWVTLLTLPSYLPGTVVLDYSLKAVGSKYPLIAMVSHDLPTECREVLTIRGIEIVEINKLAPKVQDPRIKDERFKECWSKLKAFWLYRFKRVVLLDSDMLVRRNMDELLEMPLADDWIAANHVCACNPRKLAHYPVDWIPENCAYTHPINPPPTDDSSPRPYGQLNAGLVVLNPSEKLYSDIDKFVNDDPRTETFQFTDQDLLATYFKGRWQPLPYYYNALKTLRVIHKNLWKDEDIRCLHYILTDKPWMYRPKRDGPRESEYYDLDVWWWDAFEGLGKEFEIMTSDESRTAWQYLLTQCGE